MYQRFFKRFFDLLLSFIAIILLALPMLIVALITKLDSRGPVLFRQKRIGQHKKIFTILKFRSMPTSAPKDTPTHLLGNGTKLTKWQRFIRRASIDELPQLFNILIGHMSVVGPRPALWNQEDLLAERDKYGANDLKPGLTGWAQINGRDELDNTEKARLDGEYTQRLKAGKFRGFAMDVRCFFGTFGAVIRAKGVTESRAAQTTHSADGDHHE